jgi:hypothetical protein
MKPYNSKIGFTSPQSSSLLPQSHTTQKPVDFFIAPGNSK